jgi:hypothetical protein
MAGRIISMYELGGSVGERGNNFTNDVMLIKYFLFVIFFNGAFQTPFQIDDAGVKPSALQPINGVFTPDLISWIRMFQRQVNQRGAGPVVVDGRIDPGGAAWGLRKGRSPAFKTIMALNQALVNSNRDVFERLTDPNMPGALRSVLQTATSIG